MPLSLKVILTFLVSYLIGGFPTAYIVARLVANVDITRVGSGNVGATNVSRILGKGWGSLVLLLDILKGLVVVICFSFVLPTINPGYGGLAAVLGHACSPFLRFKGGKGVATTLGTILGLAFLEPRLWLVFLGLVLLWFLIYIPTRIVSLASICAACLFPVLLGITGFKKDWFYFSLLLAAVVIVRHKNNLKRLIKGEEPRTPFLFFSAPKR